MALLYRHQTESASHSPATKAPIFEERLLPHMLDYAAAHNPHRVQGIMPRSSNVADGFVSITLEQLRTASNYMAYWIDSKLGRGSAFEPIAYQGVQDFRYWIMEFAAVKTGHPLLLVSPRNSTAIDVSLFKNSNCSTMFFSAPLEAKVQDLASHVPGLTTFQIPSLDELLSVRSSIYSYTKTYSEAATDPIFMIHTSGSTGNPKIVTYQNDSLYATYQHLVWPEHDGRKTFSRALYDTPYGAYLFSCIPHYHISGIAHITYALSAGLTFVTVPPTSPASGSFVADLMKALPLTIMSLVPAVADDLVKSYAEEFVSNSRSLKLVISVGGPISSATALYISTHTNAQIGQGYGSTEASLYPTLLPRYPSLAPFYEFLPTSLSGVSMDPIPGKTDLFEAIITRPPPPAPTPAIFLNFPSLTEWRSKDLFAPHPTEEDVWLFKGRLDDVLVLNTGLKVHPVDFETNLMEHSAVKSALVVGTGRLVCGLLLEINPGFSETPEMEIVADLWPLIARLNSDVAEYAQISRDMILVGVQEKPFVRAAKGTVVRGETVLLYEGEIEEMYARANKVDRVAP